MELDVTKALLAPGTEYPFSAQETLPPQDVLGEQVTFDTVTLTGVFTWLDGAVQLTGEMTTTAHATCAMCLGPAATAARTVFETFRKDANELEDEAFSFEGNRLSLTQMALTLVMLNLPMRFLCREGCKGSEAADAFTQKIAGGATQQKTQRPFEDLQRMLDEKAGKAD